VGYFSKQRQLQQSEAFLGLTAQCAQINPEVLDNINLDGFIRGCADTLNVPIKNMVDVETVIAKRLQRQQAAMMQQAQKEELLQARMNLKNLSQPQKDHSLESLMEFIFMAQDKS
jgi:hypothetical protein